MPYPRERLYDDVAQVWHSESGLFGSGRLIGKNLVLTARHVVTPEKGAAPVKQGWKVRLFAGRTKILEVETWTWIEGSVAWVGQGELDLALLELHPQAGTPDWSPKLKLRIGRIDQVQHHSVRGLGFPRGAKVDDRRMLFVPSGNLDDNDGTTLWFGIDQQYQPESPNEDWRGFSGGAVVLAESRDPEVVWIYGVAQQVPPNFPKGLDVARLAKAWEDEAFVTTLNAAGIYVEPADPVVAGASGFPGGPKETGPSRPRVPGALPPTWNLPFPRNLNFSGREDYLKELIEQLAANPNVARPQALTGLGGIGKTQLAVEYAYRYATTYSVVWWIRAELSDVLASDYAALIHELKLPEKEAREQSKQVDAVRRWLRANTDWLLIFDNAVAPKDLMHFLPGGRGHVIITSRNPNWTDVARLVGVKKWRPEESVEYLVKRTRSTDRVGAEKLAAKLGHLPLAVAQAGAYIEQSGKSISAYSSLYEIEHQEVLRRGQLTEYPDTVATTWELAMKTVETESPSAAALLDLCAFFAPDNIDRSLLLAGAPHWPEQYAALRKHELCLDDAVVLLRRFSLVEVEAEALSVHRLVQEVTRDRLSLSDRIVWCSMAVRILLDENRESEPIDFDTPHVLAAAAYAEGLRAVPAETCHLLDETASRWERIDDRKARALLEQALRIDAAQGALSKVDLAHTLRRLVDVTGHLGDLKAASSHADRSVALLAEVVGQATEVGDTSSQALQEAREDSRWLKTQFRDRYSRDARPKARLWVELAPELVQVMEFSESGELGPSLQLLLGKARWISWKHFGVSFPEILFISGRTELLPRTYLVGMEAPLVGKQLPLDRVFVTGFYKELADLGITGIADAHPDTGSLGCWIKTTQCAQLKEEKIPFEGPAEYLVWHLRSIVRKNMSALLGQQEVSDLIRIKVPALWADRQRFEAVLSELTHILHGLVAEEVPISQLGAILETATGLLDRNMTLVEVVEELRSLDSLKYQLTGNAWNLRYLTLSPEIEDKVLQGIGYATPQPVLALTPEDTDSILHELHSFYKDLKEDDPTPALLVRNRSIRPYVRKLIELEFPHVPVVSTREFLAERKDEIAGELTLKGIR